MFALEQQYHAARDKGGPDAAKAWLEALPTGERATLYAMWDERTEALAGDPLVSRYYVDPERYRSLKIGEFYAAQEKLNPGIQDLAAAYHDLKIADYAAASALLKDHPELKPYWDASNKFWERDLPAAVREWLSTLPQVEQLALREDVNPGGTLQTSLAATSQQQEEAYNPNTSPALKASDGSGAGASGAEAPTAQQSIIDTYLAKAEAARAEKAEKVTYLSTENRLAYQEGIIEPLVSRLGPQAAFDQLAEPYIDPATGQPAGWPQSTPGWLNELLSFVGDAGSIREALMLDAINGQDGNWVYYAADLRNLPPDQLAQLTRQYPQLADAQIVAETADKYRNPSMEALHDILGFNVTIDEDGYVSLNRQSVKASKNAKKIAKANLTTSGGGSSFYGGGNGGTPDGETGASRSARLPRHTYARLMGDNGGSGDNEIDAPPDPETQAIGAWLDFAGKMKLERPELLVALTDYFDSTDILFKERILREHPELFAFLQSLGDQGITDLLEQYLTWREAAAEKPNAPTGSRAQIRSLRVYQARPAKTGLPG